MCKPEMIFQHVFLATSLVGVTLSFPFQQIGQVFPQKAECSPRPGDLNLPCISVSSFKVHCYQWQLVTHTLFITMHSLKLGTMLLHLKPSGKSFADWSSHWISGPGDNLWRAFKALGLGADVFYRGYKALWGSCWRLLKILRNVLAKDLEGSCQRSWRIFKHLTMIFFKI